MAKSLTLIKFAWGRDVNIILDIEHGIQLKLIEHFRYYNPCDRNTPGFLHVLHRLTASSLFFETSKQLY